MKGSSPIFLLLSVIGILIGLFLINHGLSGKDLPAFFVLILGIFVTIKEILDIAH